MEAEHIYKAYKISQIDKSDLIFSSTNSPRIKSVISKEKIVSAVSYYNQLIQKKIIKDQKSRGLYHFKCASIHNMSKTTTILSCSGGPAVLLDRKTREPKSVTDSYLSVGKYGQRDNLCFISAGGKKRHKENSLYLEGI